MKKLYILLTVIISCTLFFGIISNAFALDPNRAYSIGCKWIGGGHDGDDFTPNVNNAYTHYASMPNYTSWKSTVPTVDGMRNPQDSGLRMIEHKVVFLNSHANNTCMTFQARTGSAYQTGVYYGTDYNSTETPYKYVGLKSCNMNNVKLITFAGCNTANGNDNLAKVAVSRGADASLGFTESIYSRTSAGRNWCNVYNNYLKGGYNVYSAALYASTAYGEDSKMNSRLIYGETGTTVTTLNNSMGINSESHNSKSILQPHPKFFTKNINININTRDMKNVYGINITNADIDVSKFVAEIESIDPNFDVNDYKLTINIDAPQDNTGTITFSYCIGNTIQTNKNYTILIENNVATKIVVNKAFIPQNLIEKIDTKTSAAKSLNNYKNEENLLKLVKNFDPSKSEAQKMDMEKIAGKKIISHEKTYFYDYYTNVLSYKDAIVYQEPSEDNVLVDEVAVTYLKGTESDMLQSYIVNL